jgi:23S rRNA A2030 N6-methylase RlmJ
MACRARHAGGGRALSRGGAAYDRKFGAERPLRHYPGSPRLVRAALRPGDRFVACELHPQDALALKREFAGDRAVEVRQATATTRSRRCCRRSSGAGWC